MGNDTQPSENSRVTRRKALEAIGVTGAIGLTSAPIVARTESASNRQSSGGAVAGREGLRRPSETGRAASVSSHEISTCKTITSSGTYEVVSDIASTGSGPCIDVQSDDVTIRGNGHTLDGGGSGIGVGSNEGEIAGGTFSPIENVAIENLTVTGFDTGIYYEETGNGRIEGVTARGNGVGVRFRGGVGGVTVSNCLLAESDVGFGTSGNPDVYGGPGNNRIEYTDIESNYRGIDLGHGTIFHEFSCNRIVGNSGGAVHRPVDSYGHVYDGNVFCDNPDFGIYNVDNPPEDGIPAFEDVVDATDNYWGAASGPSSIGDPATPFEDPVTGALADGDGDGVSESLDPGISNVHFDPFETSAPAGAGRR